MARFGGSGPRCLSKRRTLQRRLHLRPTPKKARTTRVVRTHLTTARTAAAAVGLVTRGIRVSDLSGLGQHARRHAGRTSSQAWWRPLLVAAASTCSTLSPLSVPPCRHWNGTPLSDQT